jgi:hypothetical protein
MTHIDTSDEQLAAATDIDRRPGVSDILRLISEGEDLDAAFLMAGAINLYIAALQRLQSRMHLGPLDVQNILRISRIMLTPPDRQQQFAPRPRPQTQPQQRN